MERGLLWLPLLALFIGLAWAGWHEYRKLEAYKLWATSFERAKYDIYAALGQAADQLVWGRPTRKGIEPKQTVSLQSVRAIALYEGRQLLQTAVRVPKGCNVCIELTLDTGAKCWIPFTDPELASNWHNLLQSLLESLESTPNP